MRKRIMVQCSTPVNKDAVRRESIDGVEHIIVSSFTLPDNVVMNGGLYPAEEIEKGFMTLERTLAPVEHPTDSQGNFLSASDPVAIHNFHAGAFNMNVSRSEGRVHVEKHINVQVALKTDRGKRLLDRIEELETNETPRPVHTSVGLFLEVEEHDAPRTNEAGQEYTWTGRNFVFDHDAILLDSVGAAQPDQGVGMAVNADGEEFEVCRVVLEGGDEKTPSRRPQANDYRTNAEGPSFAQIMEQLQKQLNGIVAGDWIYLVDVFDELAVFETPDGYFQVQWNFSEATGTANVSGVPIRVDKRVQYIPKVNNNPQEGENEMFKEMVVNTLKEAGVEVDGLTDEQLMEKWNEHLEANKENKKVVEMKFDGAQFSEAFANATKPLVEKIDALANKVNAKDEAEHAQMCEVIGNSDKHPGITAEMAKSIPIETLKTMYANCADAHGIPLTTNDGGTDDVTTEIPE